MTRPDDPGAPGSDSAATEPANFIREIIAEEVAAGKHGGRVHTRFPPEPNGYLHIGHAKAICINFELAAEFGGKTNLRFDDTNPEAEDTEYVEAIRDDIKWLGFGWEDREYFASDYYEQLYQWAVGLIEAGKAYVDSQTPEQIREMRGNFYKVGTDSPFRTRSVEENLDLFARMRAGEFEDGTQVLRARIDMAHKNLNMRDPVLYRVKRAHHHRTGDDWCIYPMYDYAHPLSDAIEHITHSLCSLEFEDHRPLYDWCVENCDVPAVPRQIEFARLNLTYTVMSKRKLLELVKSGVVSGWSDPRMPTLSGLRRRGVPPEAIRAFCTRVGVAKRNGVVDVSLFEHAVREKLNETSPRVMAVLRPLKVTIENFPDDQVIELDAPYFSDAPERGSRTVPLTRTLWIERDDFREDPPKKFFRLAPGREIRLRYACLITCKDVVKNDAGEVVELICTWDPESKGGNAPDGRKVKATAHWVSAAHAIDASVRLYDRLFSAENPLDVEDGADWKDSLNPESLETLTGCKLEPSLAGAAPGHQVQFERLGYFCVDSEDSAPDALVFNRTITLRDAWAKIQARGGGKKKK